MSETRVTYRIQWREDDDDNWMTYSYAATPHDEAAAKAVIQKMREEGLQMRAIKIEHTETLMDW
jgi:hypothetical protein